MKTERRYNIDKPEESIPQAIEDVKAYLMPKQWDALLEYLDACKTENDVHMGCSFIGIEGYPCVALYKQYVENKETE